MARFASDCRTKMDELTLALETTLGPGTADLALRFGLNSGPTTAGVLRGEKSRFQLFGDTVNTAARMESNGERNRIHISEKTAELLKDAGKEHWLTQRSEQVNCKGKGLLTTFWCEPRAETNAAPSETAYTSVGECEIRKSSSSLNNDSLQRLVDWNVDMFAGLLREVVSHRGTNKTEKSEALGKRLPSEHGLTSIRPIDEVAGVISFPRVTTKNHNMKDTALSATVSRQIVELVTSIANMYQMNAFHNFEHCSHVVMSTKKLLDRISEHGDSDPSLSKQRGLLSDPLTLFAIMFSALIHDLDHPGVGNAQLVQEKHALATVYAGKSVAEQNSIGKAWELVMDSRFAALCACLFPTEAEVKHFRQIVVNVVLATDLFDVELKSMRESRWSTSFGSTSSPIADNDAVNRRTTIILDLIIQASDVSHTMQHFTVYKKWNMCLLTEMYSAYKSGRTTKDPLEGWYEGELWFFDNYVIPMAQKLRDCGVFGVSCDEFLDYAKDNRIEWALKGRAIVDEAAVLLKSMDRSEVFEL